MKFLQSSQEHNEAGNLIFKTKHTLINKKEKQTTYVRQQAIYHDGDTI